MSDIENNGNDNVCPDPAILMLPANEHSGANWRVRMPTCMGATSSASSRTSLCSGQVTKYGSSPTPCAQIPHYHSYERAPERPF